MLIHALDLFIGYGQWGLLLKQWLRLVIEIS